MWVYKGEIFDLSQVGQEPKEEQSSQPRREREGGEGRRDGRREGGEGRRERTAK